MYDDFIVSDFEIMADHYILGTLMFPGTDVEKDNDGYAIWATGNTQGMTAGDFVMYEEQKVLFDDLKLSYLAYSIGNVGTNMDKTGTSTSTYYIGSGHAIAYDESTNTWTINWGKTITLPNEPGVWNHFTMVFHIDNSVNYVTSTGDVLENQKFDADICYALIEAPNTPYTKGGVTYTNFTFNLSKSKIYYYYNGEYTGTDNATFDSAYNNTNKAKVLYDKWNTTKTLEENLATGNRQTADAYVMRHQLTKTGKTTYRTNLFSMGYDNIALNYYEDGYAGELAQFIANDPTLPLYSIKDVVVKGSYVSPNPSTAYVYEAADYSELDPVKDFYFGTGAIDYATENGLYAVISEDVHNYKPTATPDKILVKCENGAEFTLAEGCGYYISGIDENGYTVASKSQEVYACWFLTEEAYENFEADSDDTLLVGDSCVIADDLLPEDEYLGNGQTKSIIGWQYTYTFGGEFTAFDGDPIVTIEMYNEIAALTEAGQEAALIIMPLYEIKEAYFSITDNTTEVTDFYYLESDFKTKLNGLSGDQTIVLFKDIKIDGGNANTYLTTVSGDATLNVDLNGHSLILYNAAGNTRLIKFRKNTTYNFYSTGARGILSLSDGRLLDSPDVGTADGCTVTLKNLDITAGQLIYTPGASENGATAHLDVDNCSIYVTSRMLGVRNKWTANISNSEIGAVSSWSSSAYGLIATSNANAVLDVTITGSKLLATRTSSEKGDFPVFNLIEGSTANINVSGTTLSTDTYLITGTPTSFTAGEGTVLTFANDIPAEVVGAEGFKLLRVNQNNATNLNFVITSNTDGSTTTIGVNYANAPYEYVVVPEATEVVGAISGILANITTGNGFWVNFYIPTSLGLEADATYNGTTMIGGVEYAVYTVKGISPTSTAKAALPIKVATVGETVYYRNATISIPDYFTAVLADAEVTEAEKALVANAANYCNELYKTVKPAGYSVYNTIVTDYADYLITAPEFESVGTVTSTDVVSQAQIIIAPGNVPMFAFTKVADATVTIGYTDIYGEAATADCTVMTHGEVEYYVVAEMHAYDMIGTITVYVNGTEALTYSLGDYINSLDPEADATTISIAKALYSYAKAVINFKKS